MNLAGHDCIQKCKAPVPLSRISLRITTDKGFPVVIKVGQGTSLLSSLYIDPANSTDVPGDLAKSTEVLNCSKLQNFRGVATVWVTLPSFSLTLP